MAQLQHHYAHCNPTAINLCRIVANVLRKRKALVVLMITLNQQKAWLIYISNHSTGFLFSIWTFGFAFIYFAAE